jgi:mono/diheme cytochrome c family protein
MLGAKVYRFLCAACHTLEGVNGMTHLTRSWSLDQLRLNLAKLQQTKPFMPPFAGNPAELEALVQFLRWQNHGSPGGWPESIDPAVLEQLQKWLDEAGTAPASASSMTWEAK